MWRLVHVGQELGDSSGRDQRVARESGSVGELVFAAGGADFSQEFAHRREPSVPAAWFARACMPRCHRPLAQKHFRVEVLADFVYYLKQVNQRWRAVLREY